MPKNNDNLMWFNAVCNELDIPENRKKPTRNNLGWLLRNLAIRNASHPNFSFAIQLIKRMYKEVK